MTYTYANRQYTFSVGSVCIFTAFFHYTVLPLQDCLNTTYVVYPKTLHKSVHVLHSNIPVNILQSHVLHSNIPVNILQSHVLHSNIPVNILQSHVLHSNIPVNFLISHVLHSNIPVNVLLSHVLHSNIPVNFLQSHVHISVKCCLRKSGC
jgi:hypothetical protein